MFDMFFELIGLDPTPFHINQDLQFVIISLICLFVIGEFFNIIRNILNFAFGKR